MCRPARQVRSNWSYEVGNTDVRELELSSVRTRRSAAPQRRARRGRPTFNHAAAWATLDQLEGSITTLDPARARLGRRQIAKLRHDVQALLAGLESLDESERRRSQWVWIERRVMQAQIDVEALIGAARVATPAQREPIPGEEPARLRARAERAQAKAAARLRQPEPAQPHTPAARRMGNSVWPVSGGLPGLGRRS
ncbi:hypothetical protein GCM10023175_53890 [Pseudonocardia xishanensis]|uniref:Uncharacterized protein n=1 Tax=Pseudonocardia xishanensis TaxID=630995 RepID=A0ABP8S022_9PSEU